MNNAERLIVFLGKRESGFGDRKTRGILFVTGVTRVPNIPDVSGMMDLRGIRILLVDLRFALGMPNADHTSKSRIVVVDFRGGLSGMVVDNVIEAMHVRSEGLITIPRDLREPVVDWHMNAKENGDVFKTVS